MNFKDGLLGTRQFAEVNLLGINSAPVCSLVCIITSEQGAVT
jgi:hypothetical protein